MIDHNIPLSMVRLLVGSWKFNDEPDWCGWDAYVQTAVIPLNQATKATSDLFWKKNDFAYNTFVKLAIHWNMLTSSFISNQICDRHNTIHF